MIEEIKLSKRLKDYRRMAGLNQTKAAAILCVSRQWLSEYERHPFMIKASTWMRFAELYGCKVSDFFIGL